VVDRVPQPLWSPKRVLSCRHSDSRAVDGYRTLIHVALPSDGE